MADAGLLGTLTFAVAAGLATFFAPCAFPLLPGYVGYYLSRNDADLGGALLRGVAAAGGALLVLGGVGGTLLAVGQQFARHLPLLEPAIGLALVVLGSLYLTGRTPAVHVELPERRASVAGFAVFGGGYALAAAGCVVPVLLGVVAQSLALPTGQAAVALGSYAGAVALPLTGVTLAAAAGGDVLRDASTHVGRVQRAAAAVMVLAGIAQIAASLSYLGVV
ncbi:cytochrome c biogenesis CcdA family protein [Salinirarus marinus]|uniref:cytochrome c biogenesis CcdA family protein n=1 Tax=Salinirarus marinus TaxID=3068310 RepID=UPI003C6C0A5B